MMPGLWMAGVLLYLGFGAVYGIYIVVKLTVILGAHSAWRWDEPRLCGSGDDFGFGFRCAGCEARMI